jgi:CheY-like chemotaxis protein
MSKARILVVDDEQLICTSFTKVLVEAGYEVDTALNGEAAVELASSKQYDVVFLDLVMPGIDGIQTCKKIKQLNEKTTIVSMTGNFDQDPIYKEIEFSQAGGVTHYLYKPFGREEILETVKKVLSEKEEA